MKAVYAVLAVLFLLGAGAAGVYAMLLAGFGSSPYVLPIAIGALVALVIGIAFMTGAVRSSPQARRA